MAGEALGTPGPSYRSSMFVPQEDLLLESPFAIFFKHSPASHRGETKWLERL